MQFIVKRKPVDYKALDPGTYTCRCVGIVGIGEHRLQYEGKAAVYEDRILLIFEALGENKRHSDGTPYMIQVDGKEVPEPQTLRKEVKRSLSKNANLVKYMRMLIPNLPEESEEIDISQALGAPCMLCVEKKESKESGNEYNSIAVIMAPLKGLEIPPARTALILYDIEEPDQEAFGRLPSWVQEKIKESTQYSQRTASTQPLDIPQEGGEPLDIQTGAGTREILQKGAPF